MQLINSQEGLDSLVDSLLKDLPSAIALDLEADNLHSYEEQLCLIQLYDGDSFHLIDPFKINDFSGFLSLLNKTRLWMHGADYDRSLFLKKWGHLPEMIWDTQIGARLIGHTQFGYASLVEHYHQVPLSKSSQREDWRLRPLPESMIQYALNDVRYLLSIAQRIEESLHDLQRHEWFIESCQEAQKKALHRNKPNEEPWNISGSGKLTSRGLHYLKTLWTWRDQEACTLNKPAFKVLHNKILIEWASSLAQDQRIYTAKKRLSPAQINRLFNALELAHISPPADWPIKKKALRHSWSEEESEHLNQILQRRNEAAQQQQLDPSLILTRAAAEALVTNRPLTFPLMRWQKSLLNLDPSL